MSIGNIVSPFGGVKSRVRTGYSILNNFGVSDFSSFAALEYPVSGQPALGPELSPAANGFDADDWFVEGDQTFSDGVVSLTTPGSIRLLTPIDVEDGGVYSVTVVSPIGGGGVQISSASGNIFWPADLPGGSGSYGTFLYKGGTLCFRVSGATTFPMIVRLGFGTKDVSSISVRKVLNDRMVKCTPGEFLDESTLPGAAIAFLPNGIPLEYSAGEIPWDWYSYGQNGVPALISPAESTRDIRLDPNSYFLGTGITRVNNGNFGILGDVTLSGTEAFHRYDIAGNFFANGNVYHTFTCIDINDSTSAAHTLHMNTNDGAGNNATVRLIVDLRNEVPSLTEQVFQAGTASNWTNINTHAYDLGNGKWIVGMDTLCNFTGSTASNYRYYFDNSANLGILRLHAHQGGLGPFVGFIGGDQESANVTKSAYLYNVNDRITTTIYGTDELTAVADMYIPEGAAEDPTFIFQARNVFGLGAVTGKFRKLTTEGNTVDIDVEIGRNKFAVLAGDGISLSAGNGVGVPASNGTPTDFTALIDVTVGSTRFDQQVQFGISSIRLSAATTLDQNNVNESTTSSPVFTVFPVISGNTNIRDTLTVSSGTVSSIPSANVSYQWLRNGAAISGETSTTYTLLPADDEKEISCRVTADNTVTTKSIVPSSIRAKYFAPTATSGTAEVEFIFNKTAYYDPRVEFTGENLTYSIVGGNLDSGLSINSNTGEISGTPNTVRFNNIITIRAQNSGGFVDKNVLIDITSVDLLVPFSIEGQSDFAVLSYAASGIPALGPELVPDPGFDNPDLWTINANGSIANSVAIVSNSNDANISISVVENKVYEITVNKEASQTSTIQTDFGAFVVDDASIIVSANEIPETSRTFKRSVTTNENQSVNIKTGNPDNYATLSYLSIREVLTDRMESCTPAQYLDGSTLPGGIIGITPTEPVEYDSGEVPWDWFSYGQDGVPVLMCAAETLRLEPLDPASWTTFSTVTVVDNGNFGVLNDITFTPTEPFHRLTAVGDLFASGNIYHQFIFVDVNDSKPISTTLFFIVDDGTGNNAQVRMSIDFTTETPSTNISLLFAQGTAVNWSDINQYVFEVGGGKWIVGFDALCNSTGSTASQSHMTFDGNSGLQSLRMHALQVGKGKFFGFVGGNQTASNVTKTEYTYIPNPRVRAAVSSIDTLTVAADTYASFAITDQQHVLDIEPNLLSIRTSNHGIWFMQNVAGLNSLDAHAAGRQRVASSSGDGSIISAVEGTASRIGSSGIPSDFTGQTGFIILGAVGFGTRFSGGLAEFRMNSGDHNADGTVVESLTS